jgi:glycosyltransferase involved in cell wall biosynthesis
VTVGYYAPLPPARTGVAHYAAALLETLRKHVSITVNRPGDINLYHIGNNSLHGEIYRRALEIPGVVILHDAVLHHLLLGMLSEEEYVAEFVYNYGAWWADAARKLWRERARSAADPRYFQRPLLKRIAGRSRAVIVHNPGAAEMVRRHAPETPVYEVPHLYQPKPAPPWSEIYEFRSRFGIAPGAFLFGVFGHLRESKRLWPVFEALKPVRGAELLLAGDFASSDLKHAVEIELQSRSSVHWTRYLSEAEFELCAHAVEACINLKHPAAGETSGIAIRLMGAGKPVLLTACVENSRFPDDACIRVDSGPAEASMLAEFMTWLAANPVRAREIGRRAREYVLANHDVELSAKAIHEAVCTAAGVAAR